ncbi:protein LOL2-like isoform X2 [Tasmannia lanceolata]|uniref:protein LOL2-like isoform X2 n=1 Tax=Tasmannia lanceolata TaxID=3420 RepID=UPI0040639AB7
MQSQLVCGGCRNLLLFPSGAANVRCAICSTITSVPPAHVNCGQCQTTLMYPYGAQSVKCAVCHYVTNVGMSNMRVPIPVQRPNGASPTLIASAPPLPHASSQTVVVENPMTVDESGKLVSNVVVGVTTAKK